MRRTSFTRIRVVFLATAAAVSAAGRAAATPEVAPPGIRNLVQNGGFEMDWMHNGVTSRTRFLLLDQSDWGYAQPDGQPDLWVLPESARIDFTAARTGHASLRLAGEAWQVVYLCGETEPTDGGSGYNPFRPLPADLARHVRQRPVRFGAWCRTRDAAAGPTLSVTMEYAQGPKITSEVFESAFSRGTHDWEYREVVVPPAPDLAMHAAIVRLAHREGGTAWFDDVTAEEVEGPADARGPNLLPGDAFAGSEGPGPAGEPRPELWKWVRRDYYRFTGWSHEDGKAAGAATVLKATEAGPAVQLTALPGGNLAVAARPVVLNQDQPRPLRVEARVWADDLRWMEVMAKDEHGEWLPQQDFAGAWGTDAEYRNRLAGAGSHDWQYVSKYFAPRKPVRELTLYLCARGFDGKLMGRNVVGTVRFAGVELRECGASPTDLARRGVNVPRAAPAPPRPVAGGAWVVDGGERMWGDNTVRLRSAGPGPAPALSLVPPAGNAVALAAGAAGGGEPADWLARFRLTEMCPDWTRQYRIEGAAAPYPFGTPPSPVAIRLGATYLYPDESLAVGINLNVARPSLGEVAKCRVVIRSPAGEKLLLETSDVAGSFWTGDAPRPALLRDGYVDARNLIALSAGPQGLPVHSAADPCRDCAVVVTLRDRAGATIVSRAGEPFGFMEKPRLPSLPDRIVRTAVDARGVLRVNGEPFFFRPFPVGPAGKADLGAVSRMLNFPTGYRIAAIPFPKELLFDPAHEAGWRDKARALAASGRDDPKLFGYRFEHDGETMMWFDRWKEMAGCQRKVAAWVREADPNHVILGAEWLFGTGTLTPDAAKHFDFLDGLEVEPAFTWVPPMRAVRQQAGRGRYLLAGMECYHFQPPEVMRWRMYSLLSAGASDVGICPSGMLTARPESISFLRGLYAEEARLEPMLTGDDPATPSACGNPAVALWEREGPGERYLVAKGRGEEGAGNQPYEVTLPAEAAKIEVLFEGRRVEADGRKFSDRLENGFAVHVYRITMR